LIVDGIFFDDKNGLVWNYTSSQQHFELLGTELSLEPYGIMALTF
jgi:hypothetical protein